MVTYFEVEQVNSWRNQARNAWVSQLSEETPEGWSISTIDLLKVVDVFPALTLKSDYRLQAYQNREDYNGRALVYAIPRGSELPVPKRKKEPERPENALEHIMSAFDGDGSVESYMQASILKRELEEVGAIGHGESWRLYHVLGNDLWDDAGKRSTSPTQPRPVSPQMTWEWEDDEPSDWRPSVIETDGGIRVVFYAYIASGGEQIRCFEDQYTRGEYSCSMTKKIIAKGGDGYRM